MKKIFLTMVLILSVLIPFAEETVTQGSAAKPQGESIPVNSVFLVMVVAMVGLFVLTIIYSLSKAVRALSTQVSAKE